MDHAGPASGAGTASHGTQAAAHGAHIAADRAVSGIRLAGRGSRAASKALRRAVSRLVDEVLAMAPRIPVRDQARLRAQFPGRSPDQVADALIAGAARASGGVGAAVGGLATLPTPPSFPVEVTAETLAVVAIEIKLVAELHEVYGQRAPGPVVDRMTAYVAAWSGRRGISLAPGGLVIALGSPLRRQLQRRLAGRAGRGLTALGPVLTGVAAGSLVNRHETRRLGGQVRDDLRKRVPAAASLAWSAGPAIPPGQADRQDQGPGLGC